MHLITLLWDIDPHQRCLQAKVKNRNEPKQVMANCQHLCRSLEIELIWTYETVFNETCTYITVKSAVKLYLPKYLSSCLRKRISLHVKE